ETTLLNTTPAQIRRKSSHSTPSNKRNDPSKRNNHYLHLTKRLTRSAPRAIEEKAVSQTAPRPQIPHKTSQSTRSDANTNPSKTKQPLPAPRKKPPRNGAPRAIEGKKPLPNRNTTSNPTQNLSFNWWKRNAPLANETITPHPA
ncbi:hypothetical protein M758_1G202900, partial [Ceratodon purpureus]